MNRYIPLLALLLTNLPCAHAELSPSTVDGGNSAVVYTNLDGSIRCLKLAIDESKSERQTFKKAVMDFFLQLKQVLAGKVLLQPKKDNLNTCTLTYKFLGREQVSDLAQKISLKACMQSGLDAFDRQDTMLAAPARMGHAYV